ncbi:hypothetical protein [Saccharopolyspora shandongensis]|uniref:hypothetical protein n=1 Tax=Saccharopolyspora shandongensis TaxID=418495 RepID=UPI0033C36C18
MQQLRDLVGLAHADPEDHRLGSELGVVVRVVDHHAAELPPRIAPDGDRLEEHVPERFEDASQTRVRLARHRCQHSPKVDPA